MPKVLPDPQWVDTQVCVVCGYSLHGLTPPSRCPECGTPFEARELVMCGVPYTRSGTSLGRRLAWITFAVVSIVYSQTFIFLLWKFSWIVSSVILGSLVAGLILLIATSKRERVGAERFVVSRVGIARLPLKPQHKEDEDLDSLIVPWGSADAFEFKRISGVWYRLRIGVWSPGRKLSNLIFDAGVRCPDDLAAEVRLVIESYLKDQPSTPD